MKRKTNTEKMTDWNPATLIRGKWNKEKIVKLGRKQAPAINSTLFIWDLLGIQICQQVQTKSLKKMRSWSEGAGVAAPLTHKVTSSGRDKGDIL